ncbi:uncharacterized protein LOC116289229, partial [Actinia tenebrosa]|uniref:Uncharacterized protein LOC116289229 n=1 Tax=Actinia tenebrosa TaxID=6105 RepID=A0A6P8HHA1_ACTTE
MSLKELQLVDFLSWIILIIFLLVVLFMVYQIAQLSNDKQETGNPVETADEPPLENDPVQMEFVPVLLWIIYSIIPLLLILCVILYLYCQPGNIQETGNPVETAEGEPDKLLQYPTQETQEPGVHPSMKFNVFLENERERFLATQANHERYEWEAQEEDSEVEEENRDTDEEREEPAQELLAYASQVVSNNSELVKGEKAKTEESEEQPSPAAKGAESAKFPLDTTNVPGDMDHSDTATGE